MPKIVGANLAEHRERVRNALFEALRTLLEEHTFDSLTMAQIASTAGVGRTAVYNHFEDKEALLLAYIQHETTRYTAHLRERLNDIDDPLQRLRVYIREQLTLGATYHMAPSPHLRTMVSPHTSKELASHGHQIEGVLCQLLEDAMGEHIIPKQNVMVAVSLINSCLAGRRLPENPAEKEFLIHSVQAYVLRGLGVDPEKAQIPDPQRFFGVDIPITHNPITSVISDGSAGVGLCPIHQTA